MEAGVTSLERRWHAARERIEVLLGTVNSDPMEPENRPQYYNYNPTENLKEDTVIAAKGCSGAEATSLSTSSTGAREPVNPETAPPGSTEGWFTASLPDELPRLAPEAEDIICAGRTRPGPKSSTPPDWLRQRTRGVEIALGRSLPRHGPRSGGRRAGDRLDQGSPGQFKSCPADISTAWWPNTLPASCISNAPSGPCAARSIRNATQTVIVLAGRGSTPHGEDRHLTARVRLLQITRLLQHPDQNTGANDHGRCRCHNASRGGAGDAQHLRQCRSRLFSRHLDQWRRQSTPPPVIAQIPAIAGWSSAAARKRRLARRDPHCPHQRGRSQPHDPCPARNGARRLSQSQPAGPCCTDGARKRGDANFAWVYAIRT